MKNELTLTAQSAAIADLTHQGFRFYEWQPLWPDANGQAGTAEEIAVLFKGGRNGRQRAEVYPDGTVL